MFVTLESRVNPNHTFIILAVGRTCKFPNSVERRLMRLIHCNIFELSLATCGIVAFLFHHNLELPREVANEIRTLVTACVSVPITRVMRTFALPV